MRAVDFAVRLLRSVERTTARNPDLSPAKQRIILALAAGLDNVADILYYHTTLSDTTIRTYFASLVKDDYITKTGTYQNAPLYALTSKGKATVQDILNFLPQT